MAMYFLDHYYESMQANGVTPGEKLMDLGRSRMIRMIFLHFIYTLMFCLVS